MSAEGPTVFNKRLGAAVRSRRVMLGLSQQALASQLGVTFQQQQKRESGKNRISAEDLVLTAEFLTTTPQALIDEACAQGATPAEEAPPLDGPGDRLKMEAARRLNGLSPERQAIARNVIKALAREEAA